VERSQIANRIKEIGDDIPRAPKAATELLNLMNREQSSVEAMAAVIEPDPNLTAKILRAANSAFYGFVRSIPTIQRAIPLLGLNAVRTMALAICALEGFPQKSQTPGFSRDQLWVHSLAVAGGLERLGKTLSLEADYLFLLGFLHDMGQLVLDKFFSPDFAKCLQLSRDKSLPLHLAEQDILGVDHAEVGLLLLHRWNFPELLVQPVRLHHSVELPKGSDTVDMAMLRVVNALAHQAGLGMDYNAGVVELLQSDLDFLGMDAAAVDNLRGHLADSREQTEALYAAMC